MKKNLTLMALSCSFLAFAMPASMRDGKYKGISNAHYTSEPYYGQTTLEIKNGRIVNVQFVIRDSAKHVNFDAAYEKYFANNPEYVRQCRNDWKGSRSYPDSLLKHQNVDDIDAISGATWSCNLFKASARKAIQAAAGSK